MRSNVRQKQAESERKKIAQKSNWNGMSFDVGKIKVFSVLFEAAAAAPASFTLNFSSVPFIFA